MRRKPIVIAENDLQYIMIMIYSPEWIFIQGFLLYAKSIEQIRWEQISPRIPTQIFFIKGDGLHSKRNSVLQLFR